MAKKEDLVQITCYNETRVWKRKEAIEFYKDCVDWSDGCERERYQNILIDLLLGKKIATDTEEY